MNNLSIFSLIFLLLFSLTSSAHIIKNVDIHNEITAEHSEVIFESGEYDHKIWETGCDYINYDDFDCVPDIDTAMEIASIVMCKNCNEKDFFENYKLKYVFYDEIDNVWIIDFFPNCDDLKDGQFIVGGDLYIAISRKDARVLAIWGGE